MYYQDGIESHMPNEFFTERMEQIDEDQLYQDDCRLVDQENDYPGNRPD